jgi:uncharacterized membrane protein YphA (DoxX/SURF4 family)
VPQLTGPFVGVVEIVCGCMLIFGFFTILAVIPLLVDILVAIATTKCQCSSNRVSGLRCTKDARTSACCLDSYRDLTFCGILGDIGFHLLVWPIKGGFGRSMPARKSL